MRVVMRTMVVSRFTASVTPAALGSLGPVGGRRARGKQTFAESLHGHELSIEMPDATTASDWLLSLELRCGVAAAAETSPPHLFLANGRSTSELDVRRHRRGEPNPVTAELAGSRRLSDHRG